MKVFSFIGASALIYHEKFLLQKKWTYFNRYYPEPTQLQRTLVEEAGIIKQLDAQGKLPTSRDLEDEQSMDPETS